MNENKEQPSDQPLATPISPAFELRGTSIHDASTGKLICTIWPEREASEERKEGESWLAMRQRTEPEREAIERHTKQRAARVCDFLNSESTVNMETKDYRKKQLQPMRPYREGEDMTGVSISQSDLDNGSPKQGAMITINVNDQTDKWLVAVINGEDVLSNVVTKAFALHSNGDYEWRDDEGHWHIVPGRRPGNDSTAQLTEKTIFILGSEKTDYNRETLELSKIRVDLVKKICKKVGTYPESKVGRKIGRLIEKYERKVKKGKVDKNPETPQTAWLDYKGYHAVFANGDYMLTDTSGKIHFTPANRYLQEKSK